jgi:hypothetical protein
MNWVWNDDVKRGAFMTLGAMFTFYLVGLAVGVFKKVI